jgi:cytochrome c oxidase assembly protein subunit 15
MSNKNRSIFEEVGEKTADTPVPKAGVIDAGRKGSRKAVRIWLLVLFAMVVLMVAVGGLTRLTDSGLSITEWRPLTGAIPPLNEAAWASEFSKYQGIPEFELVNKDMDLAGFKVIYWWEWGHRQLGRLVGLVWFAGFVFFTVTKKTPPGWTRRLLLVGLLGGLQGAVGWWMVSSGLSGRMVDVASYRLATHLGLAFLILSVILWYYWLLTREEMELFQARRNQDSSLITWGRVVLGLAFVQILLGALVAGIDAGRGYTDWPMMNGEFLPSESFDYAPMWTNFFENPALVQFNHRIAAYILVAVAAFTWFKSRSNPMAKTKRAFDWVLVALFGQMVLGIVTVLYSAPWQIAIFHQLCAVVCIAFILRGMFAATYPQSQSLRS